MTSVATHLQPDILECEVKWALGSMNTNKASRGDRISAELVQILKDDSVKVLYSICQQIWKTQQWPLYQKRILHNRQEVAILEVRRENSLGVGAKRSSGLEVGFCPGDLIDITGTKEEGK